MNLPVFVWVFIKLKQRTGLWSIGSPYLRYDAHRKMSRFWSNNYPFHKKGTLTNTMDKKCVFLQQRCFIGPQNKRFWLKRSVFRSELAILSLAYICTFADSGVRSTSEIHDDVIKWKHFPRNWSFVRGIHRSPVNSPHKGQWRGALMFSLICTWINGWVNNREAGDFGRYWAHYDVTVMLKGCSLFLGTEPWPLDPAM